MVGFRPEPSREGSPPAADKRNLIQEDRVKSKAVISGRRALLLSTGATCVLAGVVASIGWLFHLPGFTLVGVLSSIVAGFMVNFGLLSRRRAEALHTANAKLQEEMDERKR